MKFYNYLTEGRSKGISREKAMELIKSNCSDAWNANIKDNIYIYRGVKNSEDFLYINSGEGELRKSANTKNYYTILFSYVLPSWKKYPRRNKGIICSNNMNTSKSYGKLFIVFPYDKIKIGICSQNDIWDSFYKNIPTLTSFNYWFDDLVKMLNLYTRKNFDVDNEKEMIEVFKLLDQNMKNDKEFRDYYHDHFEFNRFNYSLEDYYWNDMDRYGSIINFFDKKIFHPEDNGFILTNTKNMNDLKYGDREVWFSGKAIMISEMMFSTIRSLIG